jgi:hypothetical protein
MKQRIEELLDGVLQVVDVMGTVVAVGAGLVVAALEDVIHKVAKKLVN